jgi:hypothetical protein
LKENEMTTKNFLFDDAAETAATGASGWLSCPNPYKTVSVALDDTGTSATVLVYGSIDGGVHQHLLDTLTLTGASGEDAYEGTNAYDAISLDVTAITGTIDFASVRYAHN